MTTNVINAILLGTIRAATTSMLHKIMKTKTNKTERPRAQLGITLEELQKSVNSITLPKRKADEHIVLSRKTVRRLIKWARLGAEWQSDQATHNEMRKKAEAESRWLSRLEEGLK